MFANMGSLNHAKGATTFDKERIDWLRAFDTMKSVESILMMPFALLAPTSYSEPTLLIHLEPPLAPAGANQWTIE